MQVDADLVRRVFAARGSLDHEKYLWLSRRAPMVDVGDDENGVAT